ncbi:putative 3-mercaptopyruvate sulfurtransferase [Luteimonas sp. 9C]|uniref:sulfurtransferase n=1 Tax=Luteimonas sp. 9C TaxID=2653148 RepID=UPI0012F0185C|nr:sulfurtransferase [Luteimonas sp. 9C]VXB74904.1 putative 3-mercaptopyruvate sulfurtransferase [Luteimonas sp. 9C]
MSARWTTLVDASTLAASLGATHLRIVDCRFTLAVAGASDGAGASAWREGHIPGAVYAHLERDLSGPKGPGLGRHPWPSADAFAAMLSRLGIAPGTQVVAYDDSDGAFAARLWWLLRSFGHRDVAVLDGGWAAWRACEGPVETTPPHVDAAPLYAGGFDAARLLRDANALQRHLDAGGLLLDARAGARFRGEVEPLDPRAGHVPGARNRPYTDNLDGGRFKPADALASDFDAVLGGHAATELAVMCGSGVTACHHLLAMAHAGREGAMLYAPSWSGWVDTPGRHVAVGAA